MRRSRLKVDPEKIRRWQERSRSRLPAVSEKRREAWPAERAERAAVFARDKRCQLVDTIAGRCFGALTAHHLLKASGGGKYERSNLVTLCAFHNGWVEDHPAEAARLGLVIRRLP